MPFFWGGWKRDSFYRLSGKGKKSAELVSVLDSHEEIQDFLFLGASYYFQCPLNGGQSSERTTLYRGRKCNDRWPQMLTHLTLKKITYNCYASLLEQLGGKILKDSILKIAEREKQVPCEKETAVQMAISKTNQINLPLIVDERSKSRSGIQYTCALRLIKIKRL